jgi:hypothetical protein
MVVASGCAAATAAALAPDVANLLQLPWSFAKAGTQQQPSGSHPSPACCRRCCRWQRALLRMSRQSTAAPIPAPAPAPPTPTPAWSQRQLLCHASRSSATCCSRPAGRCIQQLEQQQPSEAQAAQDALHGPFVDFFARLSSTLPAGPCRAAAGAAEGDPSECLQVLQLMQKRLRQLQASVQEAHEEASSGGSRHSIASITEPSDFS